jgi:hypothetical protein
MHELWKREMAITFSSAEFQVPKNIIIEGRKINLQLFIVDWIYKRNRSKTT